jgi:acetyl esterase/lipase
MIRLARGILLGLLVVEIVTKPLGAQRVERRIPYRTNPTREQFLDLYSPAATRRAPVVLFVHGGSLEEAGERRDSPMYAPVCPGLASRGILCATMDYRLAPTYRWPAMPEDVAAAVQWLKDSVSQRGGDPDRIVLVGHSSGCHLAALVALDSTYFAEQGLRPGTVAGVVAMGCTLAPWDTGGRGVGQRQLEQTFARDEAERRVYGSLAWRLRANPTAWVGPRAPPFLVLVAESERFMPSILEEGARFVRLLRELGRPADLRILNGRRHVTTTTGFADPADMVANLVAGFVRDPTAVTRTP